MGTDRDFVFAGAVMDLARCYRKVTDPEWRWSGRECEGGGG